MRKILFGVLITLIILFSFKYCEEKKESRTVLQENSMLIQEQIRHVGKLVVTEGHFSEVFNYKNSKEILGDYFTSEKKALVVVNAEVTLAYDLSKIEFSLDEGTKIHKKNKALTTSIMKYYQCLSFLLINSNTKMLFVFYSTVNLMLGLY